MLGMLLAYDAEGNVVGTLDFMVQRDAGGKVVGLIDFTAREAAGLEHLEVWNVDGAVGSKVWPEWIGGRAHDFQVELEGPPGAKRIAALVHRGSGVRRERHRLERAIAKRMAAPVDGTVDLRDLVGGPDRPLLIDSKGRGI